MTAVKLEQFGSEWKYGPKNKMCHVMSRSATPAIMTRDVKQKDMVVEER